jgi:O-antigen polymerase
MQILHSTETESRSNRVIVILLTLMFIVAPFYYQDNLGGEGLSLPFNTVVWLPVLAIIAAAIFKVTQEKAWLKPNFVWLTFLFPLGLWLSGFISGMDRPGEWLIRLGVVWGGVLFWIAVMQFRLRAEELQQLLYLLLASLLLHALVGLFQLTGNPLMRGWIPVSADHRLLGMFQQPNLQASLMATAIALSLWLALSKSFAQQRWPMLAVVYLSLFLGGLEVAASGSRVGLLGALLATLLILIGRIKLLAASPVRAIALAVVLVSGVVSGYQVNDGALQAYNKIERMAEEGKDARPHIYRIAWDLFQRAPWVGHGIGSFQREFQNERVTYYEGRDASAIDGAPRFSHPHNELLFWLDEGGVLAVLAIGLAVVAVIMQLARLGWREGVAGAALLLPITLHTQVELPFYISTYHWLILLVLLVPIFQQGLQLKSLNLSLGARSLLRWTPVAVVPLLVGFLVHSLLSQTGIMNYVKSRGTQLHHLSYALNNLYFKELAEYFVMRGALYSGLEANNRQRAVEFIDWAVPYLKQVPDIQLYRDLAIAYQQVDEPQKALAIITEGSAIYPKEMNLADAKQRIEKGELLNTASVAQFDLTADNAAENER